MNKFLYSLLLLSLPLSGLAQAKSAKRGIGWDEKIVKFCAAHAEKVNAGDRKSVV